MSDPTKTYRVYCYDAGRHEVSADWIEAESDEEAIAKALAAGYGTRCELWQARRLVAKLGEDQRQSA